MPLPALVFTPLAPVPYPPLPPPTVRNSCTPVCACSATSLHTCTATPRVDYRYPTRGLRALSYSFRLSRTLRDRRARHICISIPSNLDPVSASQTMRLPCFSRRVSFRGRTVSAGPDNRPLVCEDTGLSLAFFWNPRNHFISSNEKSVGA